MKVFAELTADEFVGRTAELERMIAHAASSGGLVVHAVPSAGSSELLRQAYDQLFLGQDEIIPFYFEIKDVKETARSIATRFLHEFLLQTVAFRRRDAAIIDSSPEICEIAELAVPADGHWVDRLIDTSQSESRLNDDRSAVRNCLSAPLRAAAAGARSFVMIDNVHRLSSLDDGDRLFDDLREIFSRSSIPFVFCGHRRFLFARTDFARLDLNAFDHEEAGRFAEALAVRTGVAINDQTRDLIALQLGGVAGHIKSLFASAAAKGTDLNSFEKVEQVYTDEIFGGRIGRSFDSVLDRSIEDETARSRVLALLSEANAADRGRIPYSYFQKHARSADDVIQRTLAVLNNAEIVSTASGMIEVNRSNHFVSDLINSRMRLESAREPRGLAVGEALAANIKRAPQLMARFYRRNSAIGLRELMRSFDGRQVSPAVIDYARFNAELKGADDGKILRALQEDNARLALPQVVYTGHTEAFYPKFSEICDAERSAVAIGFADQARKDEVVWIAAEIDSKLEAGRDLAEFWCDRLEMAALSCNFERFTIWLIAPEGFDAEAMELIKERSAYGSSRKQAALLAAMLNIEIKRPSATAADEYEITVPMGEDTEIIAAQTVEEIARRHNFPAKAINQIKTAVVEACINAAEHSLSPDGKIHQKFSVEGDKLTITISNRGVRLADKPVSDKPDDDARRGWGLKLIQGLMDEVEVEQTDDGTRITMVKYLKAA